MSAIAEHKIKCAGGGFLKPSIPYACHPVGTSFERTRTAHSAAIRAGWSFDPVLRQHRCPAHDGEVRH